MSGWRPGPGILQPQRGGSEGWAMAGDPARASPLMSHWAPEVGTHSTPTADAVSVSSYLPSVGDSRY